MGLQLTEGQLVINNEAIAYVPNTLTYKDGKGEIQVNTNSVGGGAVQVTHGFNVENAKSMVKFGLRITKENEARTATFFNLIGANVLEISDSKSDFAKSFTGMSLMTDPEKAITSDGTFELVFEGAPAL